MNSTANVSISTHLASAFLIYYGEITLSEIRALPLVDSPEVAQAIAEVLCRHYEVERFERTVERSSLGTDDVIRIVCPVPNLFSRLHSSTLPDLNVSSISDDSMVGSTESKLSVLPPKNLADSIWKKFEPIGGVTLERLPRELVGDPISSY